MTDAKQEVKDVKPEVKADVLNGIETVVFDLDGTLYDNRRGLQKKIVRRLWWSLPLMAIDRTAKGRVWRWIVHTRWHRDVYLATMTEVIGEICPRRERVIALAKECHERGLKTAIYSDYGSAENKLKVLHVNRSWFDLVVTAPELDGRKPSRVCAQRVLDMLKARPETTLFVGDRVEKDGAAAQSVGAKFLWIGDWK